MIAQVVVVVAAFVVLDMTWVGRIVVACWVVVFCQSTQTDTVDAMPRLLLVMLACLFAVDTAVVQGGVGHSAPSHSLSAAIAGPTVPTFNDVPPKVRSGVAATSRSHVRRNLPHTSVPLRHSSSRPRLVASGTDVLPPVWQALAQCEASGNPTTNTGNGYYGDFQMNMGFWTNYHGTQFAARPDLASAGEQLVVARRGLAVQGPGAWPVCGRRVHLQRGD